MEDHGDGMNMGFPSFFFSEYDEPIGPKYSEEHQGNLPGKIVRTSNQPNQTRFQHLKTSSEITKSLCAQQKLYLGTNYDKHLQDINDHNEAAGMTEKRFSGNNPMNNQGSNTPYVYSALSGPTKADDYQRDNHAPVQRKTGVSITESKPQSGYSSPSGIKSTCRSSQEQVHDPYGAAFGTESSRKTKDQQIASNNECDYISMLESKVKEMEGLIKSLQLEKEKLSIENLEKDKRSKKLAQQVAQMIEIGGNFEDVNDEISCSNITNEYSRLNKDWANLSRNIIKSNPSISELDVIHSLSGLMKFCYYKCSTTADKQIRKFWLLDDTENVPQHPHLPQILHLRKCTSKEDWVRKKIEKDVFTELRKTHADTFKNLCTEVPADKVKDSMDQFFHKYIDCCWLVAISYPSLILNFEVVGKLYVGLLTERWSEYSMNDPVEDMQKPSGTIVEVAWPCVERLDGSGFYAKGEVVIVRRADNKSDE